MKRLPVLAWLAATAALLISPQASAQQRATYEKMVAEHAKANNVPEALVHRVIVRESKYHPELIGHGGTIGLMQIKLATARGVGYTGDAGGLRDPDTNLTYGVKYLAGAWRAAEGNHDRAVQLYAGGYYHVAKQQRLARLKRPEPELASAPPQEPAEAEPEQTEKPKDAVTPKQVAARPKAVSKPVPGPLVLTPILAKLKSVFTPSPKTTPKTPPKKLAEAKERVPRPPAGVSSGANAAQPR